MNRCTVLKVFVVVISLAAPCLSSAIKAESKDGYYPPRPVHPPPPPPPQNTKSALPVLFGSTLANPVVLSGILALCLIPVIGLLFASTSLLLTSLGQGAATAATVTTTTGTGTGTGTATGTFNNNFKPNYHYTGYRIMEDSRSIWDTISIVEWISAAQKLFKEFDWKNKDCQKRLVCEIRDKPGYISSFMKIFDVIRSLQDTKVIELPESISLAVEEYGMASDVGRNLEDECGNFFSSCSFSISQLFNNSSLPDV